MIEKTSCSGIKDGNISRKEFAEELQKRVTTNFKKRNVHSLFIDNIWGPDLADIQLISKFNKGICFLLFAFYIYNKYTWVIPLKVKKGITNTNAFQKILDEWNGKPNKI